MVSKGKDFIYLVSIELVAYDRPSVSKGACRRGREIKNVLKKKTYKTRQLAGGTYIRNGGVTYYIMLWLAPR